MKISLTAYDPSRFGRIDGKVLGISADAITDQQTGAQFYLVDVSIDGNNSIAGDSIDGDAATATARGAIDFDLDGSNEVVANANDFNAFMTHVDTAIGRLNGYMNQLGIDQRSLSGKEVNLTEAITANNAAKSRIMDVDFAKEQSNSVRLQILQQTATAALSQANMGPQAVLGFLGQ